MELENLNSYLSNPSNENLFTQFFHGCIDEICGYPGPNYQQFVNIGWSNDEYKYFHKYIIKLFKNPLVLYCDTTKMPQEFLELPENIKTKIISCVNVRLDTLTSALITEVSQREKSTVTDFDWRVKMIMGSSHVASLKLPVVQLDLLVKEKNIKDIINVEMDRDQLDCFIKTLEAVL
ncbi:COMM domain-containing protein 8 [Microplitis demolitor]|uniref:COMM domain-containing protein 8 n=1 Tax=Microplitis demolitor TaxID=69319 RepID=UPI00235B6342|nr:COMM domain-containing protein 8 [Microplitis demolitor]